MTIEYYRSNAKLQIESDSSETLRACGWSKSPTPRSVVRNRKDSSVDLDYRYHCVSCWIEAIQETAQTGVIV
jgi:hypothetical protein